MKSVMQIIGKLLRFVSYTTLSIASWPAMAAPKSATEHSRRTTPELAHVSIVRYEDKTLGKNFGYMPDSLTEAIDKSLRQRFEYIREDPQRTAVTIAEFRKKHGRLDADGAIDFCRLNKSDILIFGSFEFDAQKNEIIVHTSISMGVQVNFRDLAVRRNAVDASIFGLADLVADDIVKTLIEIAKEQVSQKATVSQNKEKMQLYRSEVVTWVEPNWNLFFGAAGAVPINSFFTNYRTPQPAFSLLIERRLYRRFFAGLTAGATRVRAAQASIDLYQAAAVLGYHYYLSNRWDLFVLGGAGYYAGQYKNNSSCTALCPGLGASESLVIYNPYFSARLGINFLALSWLSISAFAQIDAFFDRPSPLYFPGAGLAVGSHF